MRYLLLLIILIAPSAYARDFDITVNVASYHLPYLDDRNWNEFNPGIGVETRRAAVGYYYNSYRSHSFYAAHRFAIEDSGNLSSGLFLGLASGYSEDKYSFGPGLIPLVGAYGEYRNVRIMFMVPGVFALQLRF